MIRRRGLTILVAVALLVACGGGNGPPPGGGPGTGVTGPVGNGGQVVGGACRTNADCASTCNAGGDFPGMCTVPCRFDGDCPGGSSCIGDNGGMCAINCRVNADCRGVGGAYVCGDKSREPGPGDALVCRLP